tara:strand:- start:334 stop:651 length:318 start_codon:yes stop_codon:yes gene_type:complete
MKDNTLSVGDIAAGTWGYSMTIPVFVIITRRTEKTIWFKEIRKDRVNEFGNEMPHLPASTPSATPERRARVKNWPYRGENEEAFKYDYAFMKKWNGNPIYANYMD